MTQWVGTNTTPAAERSISWYQRKSVLVIWDTRRVINVMWVCSNQYLVSYVDRYRLPRSPSTRQEPGGREHKSRMGPGPRLPCYSSSPTRSPWLSPPPPLYNNASRPPNTYNTNKHMRNLHNTLLSSPRDLHDFTCTDLCSPRKSIKTCHQNSRL